MKIKKLDKQFSDYQVELSWGQLLAIKDALSAMHDSVIGDELLANFDWYLSNLPEPGQNSDDLKKAEEAAESGMDSPDAAQDPNNATADERLPAPEGSEAESGNDEPPERPGASAAHHPADDEGPEEESPADKHLPAPPED